MPLIRKQKLDADNNTWLALWQMSESLEQLPVSSQVDLSAFPSLRRKKEKLTEYLLLKELTGEESLVIRHNDDGAPFVDGYFISLSHTEGWAAMILSKSHRVGIDIEYVSERVNRVASRFIREDEQQATLAERLINWCSKESVYKFFTEQHLEFHEMRLQPYSQEAEGNVLVENLRQRAQVSVNYEVNNDFVLAYLEG
jgi:phosphopantetheinyl transferase